jgi:integrase
MGRWPHAASTWGELLEEWLASTRSSVKASTYASYEHYTRAHLIPGLGHHELGKLTPELVQSFLQTKSDQGLAPQTVRHLRAILRRALNVAIRWRRLAWNRAQLVDPPRVPRRRQRRLTPEQAKALLAIVGDHRLGTLYTLALSLGMRQGQALGLRWVDVDFDGGLLHLEKALVRVGGEYFLDDPKMEASIHTLPLPAALAELLRAHRARQAEARLAAGPSWVDNGLVFTTENGAPLNRDVVTQRSSYRPRGSRT